LLATPHTHQAPQRLFELIQVQASAAVFEVLANLHDVVV
jgi:hypothetical protein